MSNYMYNSMVALADRDCASLIKAEDNDLQNLYYKAIALIIVSRLRPFLRPKSQIEIYQLLKNLKALAKLKAAAKHTIAAYIIKYL